MARRCSWKCSCRCPTMALVLERDGPKLGNQPLGPTSLDDWSIDGRLYVTSDVLCVSLCPIYSTSIPIYNIIYIIIYVYIYIYIIHILLYTVYSRGISIFPRYFHRIPMAWRWRARCPLPLRSRWVPGERQRRCDLCGPKAYPWPTAVHKWGEMPHQAARTSWFWMILWIWELVKIMI